MRARHHFIQIGVKSLHVMQQLVWIQPSERNKDVCFAGLA